jgi:hypothetical protein
MTYTWRNEDSLKRTVKAKRVAITPTNRRTSVDEHALNQLLTFMITPRYLFFRGTYLHIFQINVEVYEEKYPWTTTESSVTGQLQRQ